jgi:hypothetical protein
MGEASTLEVHMGETVQGADITVPILNLHAVSGVVQAGTTGKGLSGLRLTLAMNVTNSTTTTTEDRASVTNANSGLTATTLADGSFRFVGVPDGQYTLSCSGGPERSEDFGFRRGASAATSGPVYKSAQMSVIVNGSESAGNVLSLPQ